MPVEPVADSGPVAAPGTVPAGTGAWVVLPTYNEVDNLRSIAADLGLGIDLYQPFRDFEGMPDALFARSLERADNPFPDASLADFGS